LATKPKFKEVMEYLRTVKPKNYELLEIDLSTAREDEEIKYAGDFLLAKTDGELSGIEVRFNEKNHPKFKLSDWNPIITPFYRFFLTNTAQSGKKLKLFVGKDASAVAGVSQVNLGNVGLLNTAGEQINPAKEDGNLASIKNNTDKLDTALSNLLKELNKIPKGKPFRKTLTYSAPTGTSTQTISPTDLVSGATRIFIKSIEITTSTNTSVTALKVDGIDQEYTQSANSTQTKDFKNDCGEDALMETSIEISYDNGGSASEDQTIVVLGLFE